MLMPLLLALAASSESNEFADYEACILRNAARLERTGEPAEVVADAAVTACHEMKRKFVADYVNDPKRRGYMSIVEAGKLMTDLLNGQGRSARNTAILLTMESRLARQEGAN
jgi:hypothetical protein